MGLEFRLIEAVDSSGRRIANAISRDARYRFSHHRVAEAARVDLSEGEQREVHLRIARRLVGLGDDRLFEAARHISAGGKALADHHERIRFIQAFHRAALKARGQASFPLALDTPETAWVSGRKALGRRLSADTGTAAQCIRGGAARR